MQHVRRRILAIGTPCADLAAIPIRRLVLGLLLLAGPLLATPAFAEDAPASKDAPAPKEAPAEREPAEEEPAPKDRPAGDKPAKQEAPESKDAPASETDPPPEKPAEASEAPTSDAPASKAPASKAPAAKEDPKPDEPAEGTTPSKKEAPANPEVSPSGAETKPSKEGKAPTSADEGAQAAPAPASSEASKDTKPDAEAPNTEAPDAEAQKTEAPNTAEEPATTEAAEDGADASDEVTEDTDITPVPRALYWRDSSRAGHRIAPDGRTLAWIETREGESIVRLAPLSDVDEPFAAISLGDVVVTGLEWATSGPWLLANITPTGREAPVAVVIQTKRAEVWRPYPKAQFSRWMRLSRKRPGEAVCSMGSGYPYFEGRLYIVNWRTRTRRRLTGAVPSAHVLDDHFRVRARWLSTKAGAVLEVRRAGSRNSYRRLGTFPGEHAMASEYLGASRDGEVHYLADTRTTNTAALVAADENTGETTVLAKHPKASLTRVLWSKEDRQPLAAQFDYDRPRWKIIDKRVAEDMERLERLFNGAFDILGRDDADRYWVLSVWADNEPYSEHLYDRKTGVALRLSDEHAVPSERRTPLEFVEVKTRDGLTLPCNLALPRVRASGVAQGGPHPLVVLVHGGPQSRTAWRYDPFVQILTDRGYAVLDVNFRGSTGFGVRFREAARGEWGRRMQNDLLDAAAWAVEEGIALEDRIAIVGASYGGYATLMALVQNPEVFCCGIAMGPVVDLASFVERNEAAGRNVKDLGTSKTRGGRKNLLERSPLNHAAALTKRPLLLVHGLHDARLPHEETAELAKRIAKQDHELTFVTLLEEGHTLDRPETARTLAGLIETFLARHLEGHRQPMHQLESEQVRVELGGDELIRLAAAPPAPAPAERDRAEDDAKKPGEHTLESVGQAAR